MAIRRLARAEVFRKGLLRRPHCGWQPPPPRGADVSDPRLSSLIERLRRRNFYVIVTEENSSFIARALYIGDFKQDKTTKGPSALEAAEALERAIDGRSIHAPPPGRLIQHDG